METNKPKIIRCEYKELSESEMEALGGEVIVNSRKVKITVICFADHLHIKWNVKLKRSGDFKIFKTSGGYFNDLWNEIANLSPVETSKEKSGLCCDDDIPKGQTFYYTAVFEASRFSFCDVFINLLFTKKDPPRDRVADFKGILREVQEQEKSEAESLEESLKEEIDLQTVKKKYVHKIQKAKLEAQFNMKKEIQKIFQDQEYQITKGREIEELSKEEQHEVEIIKATAGRILNDDDKMKRLYEEHYK